MVGRRSKILMAAVPVLAISVWWLLSHNDERAVPSELRAVVADAPTKLAPLRLVDHRSQSLTEAWFNGQWSFVFLGFTNCPDICPATMAQLGVVKKSLAQQHPDARQPRYVFVSVDPRRDTPTRLAAYVASFDRDFIGVTGEPAHIETLEKTLAAFHRIDKPSATGDYHVMHTGAVYLLDPSGRVYAKFTPPMDPALVARQLVSIMAFYVRETRPG
jgi:protein SCO1